MITDYSAEVLFKGNQAQRGVGHQIYRASIRAALCDRIHISLANKHGKPHCWHQYESPGGYVNISLDPNLNETLSPVSSAPHLCDSNGIPQCGIMSHIFTNNIVEAHTVSVITIISS